MEIRLAYQISKKKLCGQNVQNGKGPKSSVIKNSDIDY